EVRAGLATEHLLVLPSGGQGRAHGGSVEPVDRRVRVVGDDERLVVEEGEVAAAGEDPAWLAVARAAPHGGRADRQGERREGEQDEREPGAAAGAHAGSLLRGHVPEVSRPPPMNRGGRETRG